MRPLLPLLVVGLLIAARADAQTTRDHDVFGRYQQFTWDERNGLPQNTVLAIATTRDGYLWLGTYEGAARFDGVRFTPFSRSNATGIGNSLVRALVEQRDGTLWLGTYGGGVSRLSAGRFTPFTTHDGLSSDLVTALAEDGRGRLWVGTDGGGVNALDRDRFTAVTTADGLPSNLVRAIVDDGQGGLLVATNLGLARIVDGRVRPYDGRADLMHGDISMVARAADGAIWVATMRGGLHRIANGRATDFGPGDGFTNDRVESIFGDRDGRVWVGTTSDGVFRYSDGRFQRYTQADGLPGVRVTAIASSIDGGMWIGTSGGLVRLKPPRVTVYTERHGLPSAFVGGILQDRDGSAWVETRGGLARYTNGAFSTVTVRDGLPSGRTRGLALGRDGRLLVHSAAGAARWTGARFVPLPGLAAIPWDRVNDLYEDRAGTIWVGVLDGGLLRIRDGQVTHIGKSDGLADDSVLSLFEDRAGSMWVGTLLGGTTRIANGRMRSWTVADGLPSNHVKAFRQDATGTLWIGTHGGGLVRFKDDRLATISRRQGLFSDDVFQILDDGDGSLWMNCNTGIWRTSLQQLNEVADGRRASVESFAYGTADGMLSSEGVGGKLAGWAMRDGSLWFPTTDGIVAIDPRRRDTAPPRVMVEGIAIDRQPAPIPDGPIELHPGQENLEIHYTGLSWSRPDAIAFRFRLAPLDHDWVEAGARRTAYYSHVPPGSYTFTAIADNGEGVWNTTGRSVAVVVLPRFHQTWWFRGLLGAALLAIVWGAWRYRSGQMRRAQATQQAFSRQLIESQERERQRIAAELHDSLGQNLLVVKNQALLGSVSQSDEQVRRQFGEIGDAVARTLEEVRAISYNLRPHHLDRLGLTTAIGAMVDAVAETSAIRIGSDLDDIDGAVPPADEITIYRIVQESLNNVVKHARATEAHVSVRSRDDHVEIVVRDNGRGFAASGPPARAGDRGGFGLKGIAERVLMLRGSHTIESAAGKGTTITVRIGVRDDAREAARHGG